MPGVLLAAPGAAWHLTRWNGVSALNLGRRPRVSANGTAPALVGVMKKLIGAVALVAIAILGIGCVTCTEVGCDSGVGITVAGFSTVVAPATLQACVNDQCQELTFAEQDGKTVCNTAATGSRCELRDSGELEIFFYEEDVDPDVTVTLEAKDAAGQVVFSDSKDVKAVENQPNGELCEPTCHNAEANFTAGS